MMPVVKGIWRNVIKCVAICLLLGTAFAANAQPISPAPASDTGKVQIIHADLLSVQGETKYLLSQVTECILQQQDAMIYFWRGSMFPDGLITAAQDVNIVQDDTTSIYADSVVYNENTRIANLMGSVSLSDTRAVLFTDAMEYNMNTEVARYTTGGLLVKDSAQLTSDSGFYYVNTATAWFKSRVKVDHPRFNLTADSLEYNTDRDIAYFHGPTDIYQEDKHIYCEAGYYDTRNKYAVFEQNARYDSPKQRAWADKIIYDGKNSKYYLIGHAHFEDSTKIVDADEIIYNEETKQYEFRGNPVFRDLKSSKQIKAQYSTYDEANHTMIYRKNVELVDSLQYMRADSLDYNTETHWGEARGTVFWEDSVNKTALWCGKADFNDSTGYIKAIKEPMLRSMLDNDSLWLRADTIISYKVNPEDSARNMFAYHYARFYKSDVQGRCDSLSYLGIDSVFHMNGNPRLWADTTQFTADTISIFLKDKKINRVEQFKNSFIVNSPDSLYYNQLKGDYITARFSNNQVRNMKVRSQGETVYYLQDQNKAYSGVNKTICEDMFIYFGDNRVERIVFYKKPTGAQYPMNQVSHSSLKLEGFQWLEAERPKSLKDLELALRAR